VACKSLKGSCWLIAQPILRFSDCQTLTPLCSTRAVRRPYPFRLPRLATLAIALAESAQRLASEGSPRIQVGTAARMSSEFCHRKVERPRGQLQRRAAQKLSTDEDRGKYRSAAFGMLCCAYTGTAAGVVRAR
jgi:hypothetical protein